VRACKPTLIGLSQEVRKQLIGLRYSDHGTLGCACQLQALPSGIKQAEGPAERGRWFHTAGADLAVGRGTRGRVFVRGCVAGVARWSRSLRRSWGAIHAWEAFDACAEARGEGGSGDRWQQRLT
jgi:hypothetical protein